MIFLNENIWPFQYINIVLYYNSESPIIINSIYIKCNFINIVFRKTAKAELDLRLMEMYKRRRPQDLSLIYRSSVFADQERSSP